MKEYIIEITETLQKQVKIKANSKEEAYKKVREKYKNEGIVLNENNYIHTDFSVISEHKINFMER